MSEQYYDPKEASDKADALNDQQSMSNVWSFKDGVARYFKGYLSPDEVLVNVHDNHLKDDNTYGRDKTSISRADKKFIGTELNYSLVCGSKLCTSYDVANNSHNHSYISSYSGTVSSSGRVNLTPNYSSYSSSTYEVQQHSSVRDFSQYYKVVKKENVEELQKLEQELWKKKQIYEDVAWKGLDKNSNLKQISGTLAFLRYGLTPIVQMIMIIFAALLLPGFYNLIPRLRAFPSAMWLANLLRNTGLFDWSPYIGVVALGLVPLISIAWIIVDKCTGRWYRSDRKAPRGIRLCIILSSSFVAGAFLTGLVQMLPLTFVVWFGAFGAMAVAFIMILCRKLGIAYKYIINNRIYEIRTYIMSGEYDKDKEKIEKIRNYTVRKTGRGFTMSSEIRIGRV